MRRAWLAVLLAACGGGGGGDHVDAAPDLGYLSCPRPDGLPSDTTGTRLSPASVDAAERQRRIKHQRAALLGSPEARFGYTAKPGDSRLLTASEVLRGNMGRIELDRGYFGDPIAEETVSFWQRPDSGWQKLGEALTLGF